MLRLFTDFHAVDPDGYLFILKHDGNDLENVAEKLGVARGDEVILDAHDGFELSGILEFRYVVNLDRQTWVALPDWATRTEKKPEAR